MASWQDALSTSCTVTYVSQCWMVPSHFKLPQKSLALCKSYIWMVVLELKLLVPFCCWYVLRDLRGLFSLMQILPESRGTTIFILWHDDDSFPAYFWFFHLPLQMDQGLQVGATYWLPVLKAIWYCSKAFDWIRPRAKALNREKGLKFIIILSLNNQ